MSRPRTSATARGRRAFTLVEVLVASTLGAMLLLATAGSAGLFGRQVEYLQEEVDVSVDGSSVASCGPGEGIGEIALLRGVPRTATVVAQTPVEAYAIDAPTFLSAVSGPAAAAAAEALASRRLEGVTREELPTVAADAE